MGSRTAKRRRDSRSKIRKGRTSHLTILIAIFACTGLAAACVAVPRWTEYELRHKSLSELQAASGNDPSNPRIFYYLGTAYRAGGQPADALNAFRKAASLDPGDEATVTSYADLATTADDMSAARPVVDSFLKVHPDSAGGHLALAGLLQRIDDPMQAYREARQAAKLDPRNVGAWQIIGDTEMRRKNYPGAEAAFAKLIALQPTLGSHRLSHGDALFSMGRLPDATSEFREAVRLSPDKAEPRVELGKALRMQAQTGADYDAARAVVNDALSRPAESPRITFNAEMEIGKSYTAQARWKDALTWFQAAAQVHPDNEDVHFQLAKCYRVTGETRLADDELQQHRSVLDYHMEESRLTNILKVDPKDDQSLLSLARLYASHNDEDRALTLYQILVRRSPQLSDAQQELQRLEHGHA